jgi:hypothetical protein
MSNKAFGFDVLKDTPKPMFEREYRYRLRQQEAKMKKLEEKEKLALLKAQEQELLDAEDGKVAQ